MKRLFFFQLDCEKNEIVGLFLVVDAIMECMLISLQFACACVEKSKVISQVLSLGAILSGVSLLQIS